MIVTKSGCIGCGLPCQRDACKYYRIHVFVCDDCQEEAEELYEDDGDQVCLECLLERHPKVELEV